MSFNWDLEDEHKLMKAQANSLPKGRRTVPSHLECESYGAVGFLLDNDLSAVSETECVSFINHWVHIAHIHNMEEVLHELYLCHALKKKSVKAVGWRQIKHSPLMCVCALVWMNMHGVHIDDVSKVFGDAPEGFARKCLSWTEWEFEGD